MTKVVTVRPPLKTVAADIKRRAQKMGDMSIAMKKASVFLTRWVGVNFKTEGGKVDGWEPFAIGGRRRKGKGIDYSAKLLRDSSDLEKSFRPFYNKKDAGIGSELPYAEVHEDGSSHVPMRRMLPRHDDKEIRDTNRKILESHIKRVLK